MGYRLSKITTKLGDSGTTSLADGTRVEKNSVYINALGAVDELNSALGVIASKPISTDVRTVIVRIQHDLFDLGAELASPRKQILQGKSVDFLDEKIEELNSNLPPLKEFILPGGTEAAAFCHVARTTCRAAERVIVTLDESDPGYCEIKLKYLNRLSDLLFILARFLNREGEMTDVYWCSAVSRV